MAAKGKFFPGIHGLRAVAAMLVLSSHAIYVANGYGAGPGQVWLGRLGVMLFFAISGFVIALQRDKPVGEFVKHRVLRIYPAYWMALALESALFSAIGLTEGGATIDVLLLYPTVPERLVTTIPYWTLTFEVTFYVVAALLFAMRLSDRVLTIVAALWIIAIDLVGARASNEAGFGFPGPAILLSPAMQVLPLGLICGIHFERLLRTPRLAWAIAAAGCLAVSFFLQDLSNGRILALGIGSASLVLAVADCAIPAILCRLGDASYGIYLIHFPLMVAMSPSAGLARLVTLTTLCGTLYGLSDLWLYRLLTRKLERGLRARFQNVQ